MEMEVEKKFSLHKMKEIKNKENKIGGGGGKKKGKIKDTWRGGARARPFEELICTAKEEEGEITTIYCLSHILLCCQKYHVS